TIRFRKSAARPGLSPLRNSTMHGLRRCTCDGSFHRNCLLFLRRTDSGWCAEMATIPVAISPVQAGYKYVNADLPDATGSSVQLRVAFLDNAFVLFQRRVAGPDLIKKGTCV